MLFSIAMLGVSFIVFIFSLEGPSESTTLGFIRMIGYFLFYLVVTFEIIRQVWNAKEINGKVIFGLTSGYISLGLLGFFVCLSIELIYPGSFQGALLDAAGQTQSLAEQLMYFSFVTLLTIGYGDILPVTDLAQKASILIGLSGQFYLVIITAVVVGKYVSKNK
ncbi:MAG: potassium channel family protein [Bacteroidota bacterium]